MGPTSMRAGSSATDGEWMDVSFAAMYAGVTPAVLSAALRDGELVTIGAHGTGPTAFVHSHAVEAWAAERESRFAALVG